MAKTKTTAIKPLMGKELEQKKCLFIERLAKKMKLYESCNKTSHIPREIAEEIGIPPDMALKWAHEDEGIEYDLAVVVEENLYDDQERFIELRALGWSYERIAKELGRSKQTVFNWKHNFEELIQNARALHLETLREKYWLTKQAKIELFGEIIKDIKEELQDRDLSEVPTDKLMELLNKFYTHLEKEAGEPERTFTEDQIKRARMYAELN